MIVQISCVLLQVRTCQFFSSPLCFFPLVFIKCRLFPGHVPLTPAVHSSLSALLPSLAQLHSWQFCGLSCFNFSISLFISKTREFWECIRARRAITMSNSLSFIPKRSVRRHSQPAVCTPGMLLEGERTGTNTAICLKSLEFGHYLWVFPEVMLMGPAEKQIHHPPPHAHLPSPPSAHGGQAGTETSDFSLSAAGTSLPVTLPSSAAGQGCKQHQGCMAVLNSNITTRAPGIWT